MLNCSFQRHENRSKGLGCVNKPIKIMLVDDHPLFRAGLRQLLDMQDDMQVVGEAEDGAEVLNEARRAQPDVVLMDIKMPDVGGIEATRKLKQALPDVKIIVLTVSDEDHHLFEALKGGAEGYLLKSVKPERLLDSLRSIMRGEKPFSPSMAELIIKEFSQDMQRAAKTPKEARVSLTPREQRILLMVSKGNTNKQIAEALFVAESTVKNHLHNILRKLHLQNRVQAAVYAMREGMISIPPEKD